MLTHPLLKPTILDFFHRKDNDQPAPPPPRQMTALNNLKRLHASVDSEMDAIKRKAVRNLCNGHHPDTQVHLSEEYRQLVEKKEDIEGQIVKLVLLFEF